MVRLSTEDADLLDSLRIELAVFRRMITGASSGERAAIQPQIKHLEAVLTTFRSKEREVGTSEEEFQQVIKDLKAGLETIQAGCELASKARSARTARVYYVRPTPRRERDDTTVLGFLTGKGLFW